MRVWGRMLYIRVVISAVLSFACVLFRCGFMPYHAYFCRASYAAIIRKFIPSPRLNERRDVKSFPGFAGNRTPGNNDLEYSCVCARVYTRRRWFVKPGMCRTSLRSSAFITNCSNLVNDLKPKSEDVRRETLWRTYVLYFLIGHLASLIT